MTDLPPLDQPQAYVVVGPNDQRGPYTMELLISEVTAGRLSEATPVWWPGLADWTTMGGHPSVAAELARRRAGTVGSPVWAEPSPVPAPAPQLADPFARSRVETDAEAGAEVVEAEIVPGATGPDASGTVGADPAHEQTFAALVARSAARADLQERVDGVNEGLAQGVVRGLESQGFALAERLEAGTTLELRFEETQGDLVTVSLGRARATRPEDLRDDFVPTTVSYRSASGGGTVESGSGGHGQVEVAADEWTGQSTSSVSLFLDLAGYLDDDLDVDGAAVASDVAATVSVLRSRLA